MSARYVVNCDWCGDVLQSFPVHPGDTPNWNSDWDIPLKGHFCKPCIEAAYADPLLSAAFKRLPVLAEERAKMQRAKGTP